MLVVDKSQVAGKQVAPPASYSKVPVAVDIDTQSLLQGGREYQKPDPEAVYRSIYSQLSLNQN